ANELHEMLPESIRKAGKITVAAQIDLPPQQFYDTDNKTVVGISADIAEALGTVLDVDFEFTNVSFSSIIPGIESGRFDIGITAMNDTEERQQQVTFVDYIQSGVRLMVKAGNPADVTSLEEMCGKSIATLQGSVNNERIEKASEENCVGKGKDPIDMQIFASSPDARSAMLTGRVDASLIDQIAGAYQVQQLPGEVEQVGPFIPSANMGMPMKKGNKELAEALHAAMKAIIADGSYLKALEKWNTAEVALEDPKITGLD
ncbi:MAG: ABC transporter substrate-binding protein, partial [Microbacterium sp.]